MTRRNRTSRPSGEKQGGPSATPTPATSDSSYRPMDAQQEHDEAMLEHPVQPLTPEQVALMKDYLGTSSEPLSLDPSSANFDPIAAAMADNPSLTRKTAERIAEAFGF